MSDATAPVKRVRTKSKKDPARGRVSRERRPSMKNVGRDPETGKSKPHVRDERVAQTVQLYVASGVSENEIAEILDIRPGLLRQHYAKELKHGQNIANMEVASAMHSAAKNGDVVAGKFWLQNRAKGAFSPAQTGENSLFSIHIHD